MTPSKVKAREKNNVRPDKNGHMIFHLLRSSAEAYEGKPSIPAVTAEKSTAVRLASYDNFVEVDTFVAYSFRKTLNIEIYAGTYLAIIS